MIKCNLNRIAPRVDHHAEAYLAFGKELSQFKPTKDYPGLAAEAPSWEKMREMIETGERVIEMVKEKEKK